MVLIIGAGPVGIYVADLLLQSGEQVMLLESGGFDQESPLLSRDSYSFVSGSAMPLSVHKVGGGSNYWHARFGEFLKEDFMTLPNSGIAGWPFAKSELTEHYLAVSREISDSDLSDEDFIRSNLSHLQDKLPSGLDLRLFRFANNYSFSTKLESLKSNPNLTLITNCRVDSISPSQENGTLNYICQVTSTDGLTEVRSQTVIVCAGTLQSTKLILNSPNLLSAPLGKIAGNGLMEHLEGHIGEIRVPSSHASLAKQFSLSHENRLSGINAGVGIRLNSQTQLSLELPSLHLEFRPRPRNLKSARTIGMSTIPNPVFFLERAYRLLRHYLLGIIDSLGGVKTYGIWVKSEEFRYSNSKVEIEDDNPKSRLIYDHKVSELSYTKLFDSLELLLPRLATMFNAKLKPYEWVLKRHRNPKIEVNWHPMGTLPMGVDVETNICGPHLQVHSNEGLYILSPAVFNRGSNGNPTFTALALASRLVKEKFDRSVGKVIKS
jgi:choline dehydrogenase-like flavoprotein